MENSHINESILSEEILEDQKKNRIDHMTYLPDMQNIGSDIMDQVIDAMEHYDYAKYTAEDVKRALAHSERTPEDFQALPHFRFWKKLHRQLKLRQKSILATASTCSHRSTLPIIVKITAFTAVSTVTTKSTVPV